MESVASFLSFTNDCFVMMTCGGSRLEKHDLHHCQPLSGYWVFLWLHVWSSYSHLCDEIRCEEALQKSLDLFWQSGDSQVWPCLTEMAPYTLRRHIHYLCLCFFCFFSPGDIRRVGLTYFDSLTHLQLIAADLARVRILALVREVPGSNPGPAPILCYVPV